MAGEWNYEVEIKLRVPSAADGRNRLQRCGFQPASPRAFESNIVYDTPSRDLQQRGQLLRVRTYNDQAILTFKARGTDHHYKVRPELEVTIGSAASMTAILEQLGFEPVFRYEKFRTEYSRPGDPGHVLLDETPIGTFLELEGPPDWIDRVAQELGFERSEYITATYAQLFYAERPELHGRPAAMVFPESRIGETPEIGPQGTTPRAK